jgi:excisionase family DNA binding protein
MPQYSQKRLRRRANIRAIDRPRLLSVQQAATELDASDAYVRRLLIRQRLYGVKVGQVWAIYKEDLENFKRLRRPPGRPPRSKDQFEGVRDTRRRITVERTAARTDGLLRRRQRGRKQAG